MYLKYKYCGSVFKNDFVVVVVVADELDLIFSKILSKLVVGAD